ncbi:hypothetical protein Leryth_026177 [Lithospermum erythrorhizon]|nr:hypothetical protein Leryth_026177 [Lithospermum erythrorhizon]
MLSIKEHRIPCHLMKNYHLIFIAPMLRQVSIEDGEAKSKESNIMFIETSAKAGFNIKPLFRKIATSLPGMEKLSASKQEEMVDVNLKPTRSNAQTQQQGGCEC